MAAPNLNPDIMQAVERLDYRVTVGDVAAQAGLNVEIAEQGLLALASDAGGHLQVAESGDIAYLFPKDFRSVLRNKYLRLRLQDWLKTVWGILFYLIRISFGILLIASIALILIAIILIVVAASASRDGDSDSGSSSVDMGGWFPNFGWIFYPTYGPSRYDYYDYPGYADSNSRRERRRERRPSDKPLNFLEGIFSFLFGDGDPNADLEDRRWQAIATVIRANRGAVIAEQLAPYLDELGQGYSRDYEEYMLPVLTRFNGRPEVSETGGLVYSFPDLQTTAKEQRLAAVAAYLKELPWRFSRASTGQVLGAIGLGAVNLIGALVLGNLLAGGAVAAELGGLVAFVASIYWLLLAYGIGFLTIPLVRYFWVQWRTGKVEARNQQRQQRAIDLNEQLNQPTSELKQKLLFAQQFAAETIIREDDLAYTTEQDLAEQELAQADKIDAEWQRRLEER
jgi:hypothetical protein